MKFYKKWPNLTTVLFWQESPSVAVGTQEKKIKLHSKNLITWIPYITKDVHFLLCQEDGSTSGSWRGPSYTVNGHGNDFNLLFETGEEGDIKVFVEYEKHPEGNFGFLNIFSSKRNNCQERKRRSWSHNILAKSTSSHTLMPVISWKKISRLQLQWLVFLWKLLVLLLLCCEGILCHCIIYRNFL